MEQLVIGKETWQKMVGEKDYSYRYIRRCFCSLNELPLHIVVSSGEVTAVSTVAGSERLDVHNTGSIPTIRELFERILELNKAAELGKGRVVTTYNGELGFPTNIDWSGRAIDSDWTIEISHVELLQH